jgi:TatD DNase family protein
MIDTHCHLTHPRFADDVDQVVQRARDNGLLACITIGTGIADAEAARELSRSYAGFVHCSAGIDPFTAHEVGDEFGAELERLKALLLSGDFVALGEVGLDYHYDLAPRDRQQRQLSEQIDLAQQLRLPVVIHVREAHEDMAHVLGEFPGVRGVIHSFTGGPAEAERYLALGWHIAFNGIVTFANAEPIREAAKMVPDELLLVETDSPYLAPVPKRGKRCEPAYVCHTAERLAEIRGTTVQTLVGVTSRNANRLFGLS